MHSYHVSVENINWKLKTITIRIESVCIAFNPVEKISLSSEKQGKGRNNKYKMWNELQTAVTN
jgi:hypothetical protein